MLRAIASYLLLLALLGTMSTRPALAHIPPPVFLVVRVLDHETQVRVTASHELLAEWLELDVERFAPEGLGELKTVAALEAVLSQWLHVRIDGLAVSGAPATFESEAFEDHLAEWRFVHLRTSFPSASAPRQVAIAWTKYSNDGRIVFDSIDGELEAYDKTTYPVFRAREPECIWHRPVESAPPPPPVLPAPRPPPVFGLPLASLGISIAGVAFLLLARRRMPARALVGVAGLGLVLAAGLWDAWRIDVPLPGAHAPGRPTEAEALALFASLHRNVYEAMDLPSEDAIYDRLAEGVTGDLLRALYIEIHTSLILEDQGGAVCKIIKTEIDEASLLEESGESAPWFRIRARWRVEGKVGHWGHTHQRVNEYLATFTLVEEGGRWKWAAMDVHEHQRVDDGKRKP